MHTVEIQLERTNLREAMNVMRAWLDDLRFEPSVFVSHESSDKLLLSVSFKVGEEAEAFASRFAGRLTGSEPESWGPGISGPSLITDAEWAASSGSPSAATTRIGTSDCGSSVT
jgi:hypothetical protein